VGFFKSLFGPKESDPELQRLAEMARDSKNAPEPQMELALAYMAKIKTPPNWNDDYAKRGVGAFQKAIKIANRHAPAQIDSIRERFVETIHRVAMAYHTYHEKRFGLKWLEKAIWLLEQAMPVTTGHSDQVAQIRKGLSDCWVEVVTWHEEKLEDESAGEDCLKKIVAASERAMSYTDDEFMRNAIDYDAAGAQITIGFRYAVQANESAVLNRQDGKLLNVNDREHKEYARQAIRLLRDGRTRLKPYTRSDDYEETMETTRDVLAGTYINLYNLTWAHSKMSQSIGILKEGVNVVPDDADLWTSLGNFSFR